MSERQEVIEAFRKLKEFYAVFSEDIPGIPYLINNRESYHDEVRLFASEEDAKRWCADNAETCGRIAARKVEGQGITTFAATLHNIGADAVVWNDGETETELELEEAFFLPDFSKLPEEKRPLLNPSLQISAIYFLQELRREKEPKLSKTLPALHEEMIVNLARADYYLAGQLAEHEGKQVPVPMIMRFKDKNSGEETNVLPVCSDQLEFEKFLLVSGQLNSKDLRRFRLPFAAIAPLISEKVPKIIVNPAGINLNIDARLAKLILTQTPEPDRRKAPEPDGKDAPGSRED